MADIVSMKHTVSSLKGNIKYGFTCVARTAYLLNSAVDPYLFGGINRRYRQAFITAFTMWRTPRKRLKSY